LRQTLQELRDHKHERERLHQLAEERKAARREEETRKLEEILHASEAKIRSEKEDYEQRVSLKMVCNARVGMICR
jgi:hypothetical protein